MQAASKQAKKPSFKCPAFSVPGKPKTDNSAIQNTAKKSSEQEKVEVNSPEAKEQSPAKPNSESDCNNKNNSDGQPPKQPRLDSDQPKPCGDNKRNIAELDVQSSKVEDISVTEDSIGASYSKDLHEATRNEKQDIQLSDAFLASAEEVKKVSGDIVKKKKKKTDFKVKTSTEDGKEAASSKKTNKVKKKKEVIDANKAGEPKQKKVQDTNKIKEKKDVAKNKPKMTLPVRSLTDEEYNAIFEAAIENAMNLNMEEWKPKETPPAKVKKPVKKKYSVTVGRKVAVTLEQNTKEIKVSNMSEQHTTETKMDETSDEKAVGRKLDETSDEKAVGRKLDETTDQEVSEESQEYCQDQTKETGPAFVEEEFPKIPVGAGDEDNEVDKGKEQIDDDEEVIDENNNIIEDMEVDRDNVVVDVEPDEEIVVDDVEDGPVEESAQEENETTPAGSEADTTEIQPDCVNTPVKKKKLRKNKKPKLEPKQLPFERKPQASMVDKILQMKKLKKEKAGVNLKKRNLNNHDTRVAEKRQQKGCELLKEKTKQKSALRKANKRQKMQQRELELNGTWVQCCNSTCMKWRYLPDVSDPILIPERWTCNMNTNMKYNRCDTAEESYDESEHIYTKFAEGSVVWARMTGYPWWPAMVEIDPNVETFYSIETDDSMFPTHYHVVFFDERVSRSWVKTDHINIFTGDEEKDGILYQIPKKGASYVKDIAAAKRNAMRALKCTIKERIELFGFAARYKGPWTSKSKDKKKSTKPASTRKIADIEEDCLDDSTMDDVLDNTEALLDNVEEMLDSLDSQLVDSDADCDFVPEELVVVEKKRKKTGVSSSRKEMQGKKIKCAPADPVVDIDTLEEKAASDDDELGEDKLEADNETESSKVTSLKLNLDSDIFTMEMDSQDENIPVEKEADLVCTDKVFVKPCNKNAVKGTKNKGVTRTPRATNKEANNKNGKEKKGSRIDTSKVKTKKDDKAKVKSEEKVVSETDSETFKLKNSEVQKLTEEEINPYESGHESEKEPKCSLAYSDKAIEVDMETDKCEKDSDTAENIDDDNKVCTKEKVDAEVEYCDSKPGHDTPTEADQDKQNKESKNVNRDDKEDFLDLGSIEVDVDSDNIDEKNMIVSDLHSTASPTDFVRKSGQTLEEESDNEFDLEEHFMYDTNADGSDKVRERSLTVPQGIPEVDEDSDPFDLMEE